MPLRRAYFRLERLFKDGTLFCFLDPELTILGPVPRDSNRLEGGLNAAPERMLVNHRGLPETHMRRACDPARILKQHDQDTKNPIANDDDNEPTSQPTLGTGIDWNEFHTNTRYPNTTD